ncbi:hypothetical protein HYQ44_005069 [Verticillium longisporum]|nr:hypothetical protein HYQ44_005069 [Verticillium longisporum]
MAPLGKIAIISIAAFAIASSAVPLTETAANGGVVDLSERSAEVLNDNGWPAPVLKPRSASPGGGRERSPSGGRAHLRPAPPLATLDFAPFSLGIVVTLPPSPIPGVPSALSLDPITGFAHGGYSFTIDVGTSVSPGSSGRWPLEEFQWRRSRGDAVASLGGRGYGWKLVRLAGGPPPGADQQWRRAGLAAGAHRGSDGAEVVAVWSEMGYSMSKALRFAFLGMGLTGLLGERWAIMAVMTAMGLFERERRSRQRRRF